MFQTIKQKYNHWLARHRLVNRYLYLNEVNKLLEGYITQKILNGGSPEFVNKARQDLLTNQRDTKENENFVNYLRSQ